MSDYTISDYTIIKTTEEVTEFINNHLPTDDDYKCPICLELLGEPMQIPCGHRVCNNCIKPIKECPLCRLKITIIF